MSSQYYSYGKKKTTYTGVNVTDFINSYVDNEQKKADGFRLIELMREWSVFEPTIWWSTVAGFGSYHYKYASEHEGRATAIGLSPQKAEFSLNDFSLTEESKKLLANPGKFKMGKACIYVKKLPDTNASTLNNLCKESITYVHGRYQ